MVPEVKSCSVKECYYNRDSECFAHSVLIGSEAPSCETFVKHQAHTQKRGQAEIGACHVSRCVFNDSLYCHACEDIKVGMSSNEAMCLTFSAK